MFRHPAILTLIFTLLAGLSPAAPGIAFQPASDLGIPELIDHIVNGSLVEAADATWEALSRGGIAISDLDTIFLEARAPASVMIATPYEALNLAIEARTRPTGGTMNADELGRMLVDFGWPLSNAPFVRDPSPGEVMIQFFAAWVTAAQEDPADPENFTPLFLAEMAHRQVPEIDLASGNALPAEVRFTLLELELFAAAFDRGATIVSEESTNRSALRARRESQSNADESITLRHTLSVRYMPANPHDLRGLVVLDRAMNVTSDNLRNKPIFRAVFQLDDSCGIVRDRIVGRPEANYINRQIGRRALNSALKIVGMSSANTQAFTSSLKIAAKIWKTIAYYRNARLQVTSDSESSVHKPLPEDALLLRFTARAGVSQEEWEEYQRRFGSSDTLNTIDRAVRDCLSSYGIPTYSDITDIARDAEKWRAHWFVRRGEELIEPFSLEQNDEFVEDGRAVNLANGPQMRRESPTSVTSHYYREVKPERQADHPGFEQHSTLEVCAEVIASTPPTLDTLERVTRGAWGLAASLTELGAGWLQSMLRPEGCMKVDINYHAPYGFEIEGQVEFSASVFTDWYDMSVIMGAQVSAPLVATGDSVLRTVFPAPATLHGHASRLDNWEGNCEDCLSTVTCDSGLVVADINWEMSGNIDNNVLHLRIANPDNPYLPPWFCEWIIPIIVQRYPPPPVNLELDIPLTKAPVTLLNQPPSVGMIGALGLEMGVPSHYHFTTPANFAIFNTCDCDGQVTWDLTITWLSPELQSPGP